MIDVASPSPPTPSGVIAYGEHPEQHFTLTPPTSSFHGALGTVALLHGGYWRGHFTRSLMAPMAADLAGRGWRVANVEYRRVGAGGGWPAPLVDTTAACARLIEMVRDGRLPGPLVLLGHSVGGQLALLTAHAAGSDAVAGILALAPVTDVLTTLRDGLGENAAEELLAGRGPAAERAAISASPVHSLPIGVPVTIIHGLADARVPHEHTTTFADAARAAGDTVRVLSLPSLEHRAAIDPSGEYWPVILDALDELRHASDRPT